VSSENFAESGSDNCIGGLSIHENHFRIARLAGAKGGRDAPGIEAKERASARHRETAAAHVADVGNCSALTNPVGAGVDIHPKAVTWSVDMELRNTPIPQRGGTAEGVREHEPISRRHGRAAMQGGGELGACYGRDYRHHGHHKERLDHCEAAPLGLEHIRAALSIWILSRADAIVGGRKPREK
jgi:hypothetical protein